MKSKKYIKTSILLFVAIFSATTHKSIKTSLLEQSQILRDKSRQLREQYERRETPRETAQKKWFKNPEEMARIHQLTAPGVTRAEIGQPGQLASNISNSEMSYGYWNFEIQNKWQNGPITVRSYYYDEQTRMNKLIFEAKLYPLQKIRAVVDLSKQIFTDIIFAKGNNALIKRISFNPSNVFYKTIYLTFGTDGSVYPQTGVFYGLTQTTDSGLDNSQNIPQSAVSYKTDYIR